MSPRLKVTIQSLVYSAFLGSFLFGFFQTLNAPQAWPWGQEQWLGLLVLVYFGTLYVETEVTEANCYRLPTFFLDLLELVALFFAFGFLGYFSVGNNLSGISPRGFYIAMIVAFICPIGWRALVKEQVPRWKRIWHFYTFLCFLAICLAGYAIFRASHLTMVVGALWVLLLFYVVDLAMRANLTDSPKSFESKERCFYPGVYWSMLDEHVCTRRSYKTSNGYGTLAYVPVISMHSLPKNWL